jgi:predicted nucleic acid-binding protein
MIVVCDTGPLHYLILIGAEHVLPRLFTRVLTPPAVVSELTHPRTPEIVRRWAEAPPAWLEIKEPGQIENIAALGRKESQGRGEKAAIALAREERADVLLMDDKTGRREAKSRGLQPLWTLKLLDEAAERGLIPNLTEKLEHLESRTPFYIGDITRAVIGGMKQRELQRKHAQDNTERFQNSQEQVTGVWRKILGHQGHV